MSADSPKIALFGLAVSLAFTALSADARRAYQTMGEDEEAAINEVLKKPTQTKHVEKRKPRTAKPAKTTESLLKATPQPKSALPVEPETTPEPATTPQPPATPEPAAVPAQSTTELTKPQPPMTPGASAIAPAEKSSNKGNAGDDDDEPHAPPPPLEADKSFIQLLSLFVATAIGGSIFFGFMQIAIKAQNKREQADNLALKAALSSVSNKNLVDKPMEITDEHSSAKSPAVGDAEHYRELLIEEESFRVKEKLLRSVLLDADAVSLTGADRNPKVAAILSILPGIGQIYNKQYGRGFLFLIITVLSLAFFYVAQLKKPALHGLIEFGQRFHFKVNNEMLGFFTNSDYHIPALVTLGLIFLGFIALSMRLAYLDARPHREPWHPVLPFVDANGGAFLMFYAVFSLIFFGTIYIMLPPSPTEKLTKIHYVNIELTPPPAVNPNNQTNLKQVTKPAATPAPTRISEAPLKPPDDTKTMASLDQAPQSTKIAMTTDSPPDQVTIPPQKTALAASLDEKNAPPPTFANVDLPKIKQEPSDEEEKLVRPVKGPKDQAINSEFTPTPANSTLKTKKTEVTQQEKRDKPRLTEKSPIPPDQVYLDLPRLDSLAKTISTEGSDLAVKSASKAFMGGDFKAGMEQLAKAIKLNPRNAKALVFEARMLKRQHSCMAALKDVTMAIAVDRDNADSFILRADILSDCMGNQTSAIYSLNEAIRLKPNSSEAYGKRGSDRAFMGDLVGAQDDAEKCLSINPKSCDGYLARAEICGAMLDDQGHFNNADTALSLDPGNGAAWKERASAFAGFAARATDRGDTALSDAYLRKELSDIDSGIAMDPGQTDFYIDRALLLMKFGHTPDDIKTINYAVSIAPSYWYCYFARVMVDRWHHNWQQQQADIKVANELYGGNLAFPAWMKTPSDK
jgi:tetratricopeptide (TPR) repeat protein